MTDPVPHLQLGVRNALLQPLEVARTGVGPVEGQIGRAHGCREDQNNWVDVEILRIEEPWLLGLSWELYGERAGRLRAEFEVVEPNRTRLILDHDGLGASSTGYGPGWPAFLDGPLAGFISGQDARVGSWDEHFEQAIRPGASAPPPWAAAQAV